MSGTRSVDNIEPVLRHDPPQLHACLLGGRVKQLAQEGYRRPAPQAYLALTLGVWVGRQGDPDSAGKTLCGTEDALTVSLVVQAIGGAYLEQNLK